jgi:hypothetical protein
MEQLYGNYNLCSICGMPTGDQIICDECRTEGKSLSDGITERMVEVKTDDTTSTEDLFASLRVEKKDSEKITIDLTEGKTFDMWTNQQKLEKAMDKIIMDALKKQTDQKDSNKDNQERYGQRLMNILHKVDPDAYQHLIEHSDCFYNDLKIENSLRQLKEFWQTPKINNFFTD